MANGDGLRGTSGAKDRLAARRLRNRSIAAGVLAFAAVLALLLGVLGHRLQFGEVGNSPNLLDSLYASLQLFVLQSDFGFGQKNWALEIARFLAPTVAAYAVILAGVVFLGEWVKLLFARNHVVVCGLGRAGMFFVSKFCHEGRTVIAIEQNGENGTAEICRGLGAVIVQGDARYEGSLRKARVAKATQLIVTCSGDADNIQAAMQASAVVAESGRSANNPLCCHLHIDDLKLCNSFRRLSVFKAGKIPFEPVVFNFYENSARMVLHQHPLDREPLSPDDPRQVHLVVIGCGRMGEALAWQALKTAHFANMQRPRLTLVDRKAELKRHRFQARAPELDLIADTAFVQAEAEDLVVRDRLVAWANDPAQLLTVAVCLDRPTEALSCALSLPPILSRKRIPVLVRLTEESGLAEVLAQVHPPTLLVPFGMMDQGCRIDEKLDRLARAVQKGYIQQCIEKKLDPEKTPAMKPWESLDERFRESCRAQADHIHIRLRAVGCETLPKERVPDARGFSFTPQEVELLGRIEHARWTAERVVGGGRRGNERDDAEGIHPLIGVPYERLDEQTKEYDRQPARSIPTLLWDHAGLGVQRTDGRSTPSPSTTTPADRTVSMAGRSA